MRKPKQQYPVPGSQTGSIRIVWYMYMTEEMIYDENRCALQIYTGRLSERVHSATDRRYVRMYRQ